MKQMLFRVLVLVCVAVVRGGVLQNTALVPQTQETPATKTSLAQISANTDAKMGVTVCTAIAQEMAGTDVRLVQYEGSTTASQDLSCCTLCDREPGCEFWVRATDSTNCWLKKSFTSYISSTTRRGAHRVGCSATSQEMGGSDVRMVSSYGTTDEDKDASCCAQCNAEPACTFWVRATDSTNCWLKKSFTGYIASTVRRGALKTSYSLCGASTQDIAGSTIKQVTTTGTTDAEKDASCCAQCQAEPYCEFWVRTTTDSTCWLKQGFTGYVSSDTRRGAHQVGCFATAQEMVGKDVKLVTFTGTSESEKDASCCAQCDAEPLCEYWVRATGTDTSTNCWLKNGFTGYSASTVRRGAHKVGCRSTTQEMAGADVKLVQYYGSSDPDKDASCCAQCQAEPACEYWVRATDSTNCWLKKSFTGNVASTTRRGAFRF